MMKKKTGQLIKRWARQFWVYRGGVWAPMEDEWVKARLLKTLYWLREERPEDHLALTAAVGDAKSSSLLSALWTPLCVTLAGRTRDNDPLHMNRLIKPSVVNCLNGERWIDNQGGYEFKEHDPQHYLTHQIQVAYDPKAVCPHYDAFMQLMFEDKDAEMDAYIDYLNQIFGYVIQLDRSLKTWVLLHGEGYNGKSALGAIVAEMLGNAAVEKRLSDYSDGANVHVEAGLVGKLLLIDDDFSMGSVLPDGQLKRLSEAKRITANPKGANEFNFVSRAVPMILSNHWPPSRDTSLAIRERAQVVDFTHYIAPYERDEAARCMILQDELPGILNHWLAAYGSVKVNNGFTIPAGCLKARDHWVKLSNSAAQFIEEVLVKNKDGGGFVAAKELWSGYRSWLRFNNPGGRSLKKQTFYERMDGLLGARVKQKNVQGWSGYVIVEDTFGEF